MGAFAYAYVDQSSRLAGVTYPMGTGLNSSYGYFDNVGDQRLQEILNFIDALGLCHPWRNSARHKGYFSRTFPHVFRMVLLPSSLWSNCDCA